jgi:hypothetical protein
MQLVKVPPYMRIELLGWFVPEAVRQLSPGLLVPIGHTSQSKIAPKLGT